MLTTPSSPRIPGRDLTVDYLRLHGFECPIIIDDQGTRATGLIIDQRLADLDAVGAALGIFSSFLFFFSFIFRLPLTSPLAPALRPPPLSSSRA